MAMKVDWDAIGRPHCPCHNKAPVPEECLATHRVSTWRDKWHEKSGQIAGADQLSAVNTNQASETKKNGGRKWRIFQYSSRCSGHR